MIECIEMKIYRYILLVIAAMLVLTSPVVYAENQVYDPSMQSLVKQNCVSAQGTLTRLHANDALARVHLGQEYETILSKLITPMNSRIVLDKFDGSDMVKIASEFNVKLDEFRSQYQKYDVSISKLIQMNCVDQPESFVDGLSDSRDLRQSVRSTIDELSSLVQDYHTQVGILRTQVDQANSGGQN